MHSVGSRRCSTSGGRRSARTSRRPRPPAARPRQILERARQTATEQQKQLVEEIAAERERGIASAQAAIEAETRQALDRIKNEIADLTLLATERVLGRTLDEAEQKRIVEEALAGVDFSGLTGGDSTST